MITNEEQHDGAADVSHSASGSRRKLKAWLVAASAVTVLGAALVAWLAALPGQQGMDSAHFGPYSSAAPPPFLVDLNLDSLDTGLRVLSANTGRFIAALPPPQKGFFYQDTAATSDSRTFIVAAEARTGACNTWLYRLRLTAQGHEATLRPLSVPKISGRILPTNDLSVSADGRMVAYSATPCAGGPGHYPSGVVGVINLLTKQITVWRLKPESVFSLTLSPNGQMLGFVDTVIYGGDGTVRSLPTSAAPGAIARSTHMILPARDHVDVNGSVAMNPDGTVMLACSETSHTATLAAYDVTSGRRLGIVHTWRQVDVAPCEVSVTPSGRYALVYNLSLTGVGTRIDLATGQATDLDGSSGQQSQPLGVSW
jgi:hypothetical protein